MRRLRIFSGPNGSGKSTIAQNLQSDGHFRTAIFVNADELEKEYFIRGKIDLNHYLKCSITSKKARLYFEESGISIFNVADFELGAVSVNRNQFTYKGEFNSYIAADVAALIRLELIQSGESFAFESVFSHRSKLDVIRYAKEKNYRIYLYFVGTQDPEINLNRVNIRVNENGHGVPENKIKERYYRCFGLLKEVLKESDRAYLFDNSSTNAKLVAEVVAGNKVTMHLQENVPAWFQTYVSR